MAPVPRRLGRRPDVPSADVVVIGAGLAGLATAVAHADAGARVIVLGAGNATTHWAAGPIDIAAPPGVATSRAGVLRLAANATHPYALLADVVAPAIKWFLGITAGAGLPHVGSLDSPLASLPTGIGGTRPVAVVPEAQADALPAWSRDEGLVIVGPIGFKDLWPHAVAASLRRAGVWGSTSMPASVVGAAVDLPGLAGRRNLSALVIADQFDDPAWRRDALDAIAGAVDAVVRGSVRLALPAALGRRDHSAALAEARERLGRPVFELPLVPPGIPGLRLHDALRAALRARGGRLQMGEQVIRVETVGRRVTAVATAAAVREFRVRTDSVVLATGGLAGGGIVGEPDGRLRETVLNLPVEGPPIDSWLAGGGLDPAAHPIAAAGIRVDGELRPIDPAAPERGPLYDNVTVAGGLLAGQHVLRERCGDGVAIASAWRVATAGQTDRGPSSATEAITERGARQ